MIIVSSGCNSGMQRLYARHLILKENGEETVQTTKYVKRM
jgi:hypothetical protein